jgi:hypothetical protein
MVGTLGITGILAGGGFLLGEFNRFQELQLMGRGIDPNEGNFDWTQLLNFLPLLALIPLIMKGFGRRSSSSSEVIIVEDDE